LVDFFRRIVDTPTNEMNTDTFVAEVRRMGEELGVGCTIIRGEELRYIGNNHHGVDISAD
jgi:probable aminopeptidase NPEPL1